MKTMISEKKRFD